MPQAHGAMYKNRVRRAWRDEPATQGKVLYPSLEGTPQGGPLSPLLSNIVLDELDKELEKRGLRFVRYADDFVVYVRGKKAAERVMQSATMFIERRLRLKVNQEKSVRRFASTRSLSSGLNSGCANSPAGVVG